MVRRSRRGLALLVAGVVLGVAAIGVGPSPAVAGTPAPPTGDLGPFSIEHDGVSRAFRAYVPSSYDGTTPVPLVLGLHGGCGLASHFLSEYGWRDQAEEDGFIVVAPGGTTGPRGLCATWNAGRCCPDPPVAVDDVGYLQALLAHVRATWSIDPGRVLVTGMSNGGMMAHRLACEAPGAMTLVGVVAGSLESTTPCLPERPVPIVLFHGEVDDIVPYDGGIGPLLPGFAFRSTPAALETWRSVDGCRRAPQQTTSASGVVRTSWTGCAGGTSVRQVRIDDHPHAWPGAPSTTLSGAVPTQKVDATAELAAALLAASAPGPFPQHGFPDVTDFFDPGVTWMAAQEITTGYADGTYRTGATVNRMQVAAFLFRMVGDAAFVSPSAPTFRDVSPSHPFFREVEWLASSGITTGWADGTFRPGSPLSRSAFATMLWRVAGEPTAAIPAHPFPDVGPNGAVDWFAAAGITTGYDDGTFRPSGTLNRGQVATFLHRLAGTHWA